MKAKNKKIVKAKLEEAVRMLENEGCPSSYLEEYITEMMGGEYELLKDEQLPEVLVFIEYALAIRLPDYGDFSEELLQKKEILGLK